MKRLFFSFLFFGFIISGWAQSKSVDQFREEYKTKQALFFYPSTLRMSNFEKDPDYDQLVGHIEKLKILSFDKAESSINSETVNQLQSDIQKEHYENLIALDDKEKKVHLYALEGDDKSKGMVGLIENPQELYVFDMEGYVDMAVLLKLIQNNSDFKIITQLMNIAPENTKRKNN